MAAVITVSTLDGLVMAFNIVSKLPNYEEFKGRKFQVIAHYDGSLQPDSGKL